MNLMLPENDLWTHLKTTDKTIVMYGMGNGADKILAVCERFGIEVSDFFASDGFVRGHSFHSKTVLSYSAVKEKYGTENIIVLLSFASSLPDVMDNIRRIASECELYAPDVPVCESELFDRVFFEKNKDKFNAAYELLSDEESRRIYENVILYKLTGNIRYLDKAVCSKDTVYRELLCASGFKCTADLGAYNGDTIRELIPYSPSLKKVFAFEPDRRSFRKLNDYCTTVNYLPEIITVNAAAWSEETLLKFGDEGNRNSGICANGKGAKTVEVQANFLDNVLCGERVDYIKYDVEGAESEAIIGSEKSILTHRPKLLISAYHRSEDIFALPLQIHALRPDYNLYLRRYPYIPAWDLNLICV